MRYITTRLKPLAVAALVAMAGLGLARPASAQQDWFPVGGAMSAGVAQPATVALLDGRVLLMGGQDLTTAPQDEVYVYDSNSNSWLPNAAPLNSARIYGAAVALPDGRALIVGGIDSASALSQTAEIYDPVANTWTLTTMPLVFGAGTATMLNDGRVLVTGGIDANGSVTTAATMLFDSSTGAWTLGPPMATSRFLHNANLLLDGRVLVSGGLSVDGSGQGPAAAAELFDPTTNTWSPAGQMAQAAAFATSAVLPDGRLIVAGGSTSLDSEGVVARAEIYDPATNQWQTAAPMSIPRGWGGGGVVADGTFVMAAGITLQATPVGDVAVLEASAEAFDPQTNTWTAIASMVTPRFYVGSVIVNGELLMAAGAATADGSGALLTSGEVYVSAPNNPPVAVASVPASVPGVAGGLVVVEVSAADSSDPDGNPLTFIWSENGTTLATTTDPTRVAFVALGVGPHTLTLTVRDSRGGEAATTAFIEVVDTPAGLQTQIDQLTSDLQQSEAQNAALTSEVQQAQAQIAQLTADVLQGQELITALTNDLLAAQAALAAAGQVPADAVAAIQSQFRAAFGNPTFVVPGADPAAQLQAIVEAIVGMNRGSQLQLYRGLSSPSHGGGHGRGKDKDDHGKGDHRKDDPKKDDPKKGGPGKDDGKKDDRKKD